MTYKAQNSIIKIVKEEQHTAPQGGADQEGKTWQNIWCQKQEEMQCTKITASIFRRTTQKSGVNALKLGKSSATKRTASSAKFGWKWGKNNSSILDPKEGIKRKGERKHEENN